MNTPASISTAPASTIDHLSIRRVGVFRAHVLGDMLCAIPALRSLRFALPHAEITLIGLPWAAELAARLPEVDRFIEFPGYPGLPEVIADIEALPEFLRTMQAAQFDLLLQLHDSGEIVNPLLAACGAQRTAGFAQPGHYSADPDLHRPWPDAGHEIERLLSLTDDLGFRRQGVALEFPITDTDRVELASLWPGAYGAQRVAVVHPGAQLPSRRWSPQGFAEVADSLSEQGCVVVLTGTATETQWVAEVQAAMHSLPVNLAGRTSLWTLGAILEQASVLVCNDTGVSHVAASLGTPSVVVSSTEDVSRWAPLDTERHRVVWHEHAHQITAAEVARAAHSLLEQQILHELDERIAEEAQLTAPGELLSNLIAET